MSEPNGPGTEFRAALGQLAEDAPPEHEPEADQDPWFAPGPKPQGYQPLDPDELDAAGWPGASGAGQEAAGAEAGQDAGPESAGPQLPDEWFIRTGRAGLLPDSMTVSWDDEDTHVFERPDTAAAPPWAGEKPDEDVEEPPPWESGPWPGPGEERPVSPPRSPAAGPRSGRQPAEDVGNWQAMAALGAGILPLVLPGAVLGVLGLRRAQTTGTGRMPAWLGIAFSAIWAVVLIVVLASGGGQSAQGCPASSQGISTTVLHDLSSGAPVSQLTADLNRAVSQANSAAAAAQQVQARSALVTLTTGLQRALAAVQATARGRAHSTGSYAASYKQLAADSAAVRSACKT